MLTTGDVFHPLAVALGDTRRIDHVKRVQVPTYTRGGLFVFSKYSTTATGKLYFSGKASFARETIANSKLHAGKEGGWQLGLGGGGGAISKRPRYIACRWLWVYG